MTSTRTLEPTTDATEPAAPSRLRTWLISPPAIAALAVVVLLLVGKVTTPEFLTPDNLIGVVRSASLTGIVAVGITFVTISGNFFSLSVEQTASIAAITLAMLMGSGVGWPLAFLLIFVIVVAIGAVQGVAVAFGANPIITTLGAGAALAALASVISGNVTRVFDGSSISGLGTGVWLKIPSQTWMFLALTVLAALVLGGTRIGRTVVLTGANADAARSSGLSVRRGTILAFTLASVTAGIAGVMVAAQSQQGVVGQMTGVNFDAAAAVLIGGTAIQGGRGSVIRTALGAIFVALLQNLAAIRGYSYGAQLAFQGLAVTVAVCGFWVLRRRSQ